MLGDLLIFNSLQLGAIGIDFLNFVVLRNIIELPLVVLGVREASLLFTFKSTFAPRSDYLTSSPLILVSVLLLALSEFHILEFQVGGPWSSYNGTLVRRLLRSVIYFGFANNFLSNRIQLLVWTDQT